MPAAVARFAWIGISALVVGLLALAWGESSAYAGWDPGRFAETLGQAEKDYLDGNYPAALAKYKGLEETLGVALAAGEIPKDQKQRAEGALEVISYQIGRCHQQVGACDAAEQAFSALRAWPSLSPETNAKIAVRLAEVHVCQANAHIAASAFEAADAAIEASNQALAAARSMDFAATPGGKAGETLSAELAAVEADANGLEGRRDEALLAQVDGALDAADCDQAQSALGEVERRQMAGAPARRERFGTTCDSAFPIDLDAALEYGPHALMATGGVLILTAVITEAVVAPPSTIDAFETARDACVAGDGSQCPKALDYADTIDGQQTTTITLVTLGVLAAGGGFAWWWFTRDDAGDEAGAEVSATFVPSATADGAALHFRARW